MTGNQKLQIGGAVVASVALLAMLAYNFVHTGGLLAAYVDPWWIGYVAAFGIELAVVALSVAIGARNYHNLKTGGFVAVLIGVVIVSCLANIDQGYLVRYGRHIRGDTLGSVDLVQGIIGLSATGLVSVIVMAMSEIGSQYVAQLGAHKAQGDPLGGQDSAQWASKTEAAQYYLTQYPQWTQARIAREVPCDPSTVHTAKAKLQEAGQWKSDNGSTG